MDGLVRVHLLPVFGDYKLDKITTPILQKQVNKWADKANKGEKGAFANYSLLHNMNKRILKYGVAIQVIQYNTIQLMMSSFHANSKKKSLL